MQDIGKNILNILIRASTSAILFIDAQIDNHIIIVAIAEIGAVFKADSHGRFIAVENIRYNIHTIAHIHRVRVTASGREHNITVQNRFNTVLRRINEVDSGRIIIDGRRTFARRAVSDDELHCSRCKIDPAITAIEGIAVAD